MSDTNAFGLTSEQTYLSEYTQSIADEAFPTKTTQERGIL